jgi:sortase A
VVREVGLGMITAGVVIILFVVYQLFGTALTEEHHQHQLRASFEQALRENRASGSVGPAVVIPGAKDLSPSTPTGVAIAHLVIPSIGVNKFVVQGTDETDLTEGPGHYIGTPMPGERGNAAIAGHRTTYGAPFYELGNLRIGASIYVTNTSGRTFDYRVRATRVVPPSDVAVLDNTPYAELTLTTCNPPYSATSRLVVVARLVGTPLAVPAAAPSSISRSAGGSGADSAPAPSSAQGTNLGVGTSAAAGPALAYGAAAILAWILTRVVLARTRRWRRAGALVVGLAVCALPLWFCFENVVRLLPPNI